MSQMPLNILSILTVLARLIVLSPSSIYACNEAICASIVSKCMLLNSCKCDLSTCNCCKDCFLCLSFLYDECCSCFELCPKPKVSDNPLSKRSHVEDLDDPIPELFQALTEEPDDHERWISFTYPVDIPLNLFLPKQDKLVEYHVQSNFGTYNVTTRLDIMTVNCTVTFTTGCSSWSKCKQACQAMGANSYRWFHDGCCECIGGMCINYGINESRCKNCPKKKPTVEEEFDDYGQDDDYDLMNIEED